MVGEVYVARGGEDLVQILLDSGVQIVVINEGVSIIWTGQEYAFEELVICFDVLLFALEDYGLESGDSIISSLRVNVLEVEECQVCGLGLHL